MTRSSIIHTLHEKRDGITTLFNDDILGFSPQFFALYQYHDIVTYDGVLDRPTLFAPLRGEAIFDIIPYNAGKQRYHVTEGTSLYLDPLIMKINYTMLAANNTVLFSCSTNPPADLNLMTPIMHFFPLQQARYIHMNRNSTFHGHKHNYKEFFAVVDGNAKFTLQERRQLLERDNTLMIDAWMPHASKISRETKILQCKEKIKQPHKEEDAELLSFIF